MARNRIRLNSAGAQSVLRSTLAVAAIREAVDAIAENAESAGITVGDKDGGRHEYPLPIKTSVGLTDRAHGTVSLAHPAGLAVQAKHGLLTKAAAQAGLDVRTR